jgi:REP element-mobilizing transposase RayT
LFRNGGKRRGAGRKPSGARARTKHDKRPELSASHPVHVTLRMAPEIGNLRCSAGYRAIRAAAQVATARDRIRIAHYSIQGNHVHLIIETHSKAALALGMQGFQISIARHINTVLRANGRRRRGNVFADRYHAVVITSPTQMRHVIAYVLGNWRKHGEDRRTLRGWLVDPFSSGFAFEGWQERERGVALVPPGDHPWICPREARTWLLREGWKRAGAISVFAIPGSRPPGP